MKPRTTIIAAAVLLAGASVFSASKADAQLTLNGPSLTGGLPGRSARGV